MREASAAVGFINMHKDISGVLTVSTCLLNRQSDFTKTSPPAPSAAAAAASRFLPEPHVSFFT